MSKEQLKSDYKAKVVGAEDAALDALIDAAQAEVVPESPMPDVQAQIDAAVAQKGSEDQVKLDNMKLELDAAVSADAQDKLVIQAKQDVIDKVKALLG